VSEVLLSRYLESDPDRLPAAGFGRPRFRGLAPLDQHLGFFVEIGELLDVAPLGLGIVAATPRYLSSSLASNPIVMPTRHRAALSHYESLFLEQA